VAEAVEDGPLGGATTHAVTALCTTKAPSACTSTWQLLQFDRLQPALSFWEYKYRNLCRQLQI